MSTVKLSLLDIRLNNKAAKGLCNQPDRDIQSLQLLIDECCKRCVESDRKKRLTVDKQVATKSDKGRYRSWAINQMGKAQTITELDSIYSAANKRLPNDEILYPTYIQNHNRLTD